MNSLEYVCPSCGEYEWLGAECACGLKWTKQRRTMPHYSKLCTVDEIEKLRFKLSRKATRSIIDDGKNL